MAKRIDYGELVRTDVRCNHPGDFQIAEDADSAVLDPADREPDERLIQSIRERGIRTPIRVRKNGTRDDGRPVLEVVAGRRRVKAARIVTAERASKGEDPVLVPWLLSRGNDEDAFVEMLEENLVRQGYSLLQRARHALRCMERFGWDKPKIAAFFDVVPRTVDNWYVLVGDCSDKAQEAVDKGSLPLVRAMELAKRPRVEQDAALAEMVQGGATKGKKAKAATKAVLAGKKASEAKVDDPEDRAKKPAELMRLRDAIITADLVGADLVVELIEWAAGKRATAELSPLYRGLAETAIRRGAA